MPRHLNEEEAQQATVLFALLENVVFEEGDDYWHWIWDRSGAFTVKSMYDRLLELDQVQNDDERRQFPVSRVVGTMAKKRWIGARFQGMTPNPIRYYLDVMEEQECKGVSSKGDFSFKYG
ncbi:hypothetical protein FRX31_025644 [Thalictrum thalictroides]|uniref:Uncharacterized protein n=1 Tax=Thalictrum thalictroides TaxID=46969 RepID=A0A7J6VJL0_THATH|nr:hypothetical protein FRX31_025644 [Thalictrum thalictroides]